MQARHPKAIMLSAHQAADVTALRQSVIDFFEASMVEADLVIPYARQGILGEVHERARVVSETFDESGRKMRVRSVPAAIAKLATAFGSSLRCQRRAFC